MIPTWHNLPWHDTTCHDMTQPTMTWHNMPWHDTQFSPAKRNLRLILGGLNRSYNLECKRKEQRNLKEKQFNSNLNDWTTQRLNDSTTQRLNVIRKRWAAQTRGSNSESPRNKVWQIMGVTPVLFYSHFAIFYDHLQSDARGVHRRPGCPLSNAPRCNVGNQ